MNHSFPFRLWMVLRPYEYAPDILFICIHVPEKDLRILAIVVYWFLFFFLLRRDAMRCQVILVLEYK